MIVRVFRATVRSGSAADFEEVGPLRLPDPAPGRARPRRRGCAGRPLGAAGEFCVLTVWRGPRLAPAVRRPGLAARERPARRGAPPAGGDDPAPLEVIGSSSS